MENHEEALLLESALASSAIGHGLAALRSYDFADKGSFFSGMFALTIGIERVLKLIFLINSTENHGTLPTNQELKNIGHDIGRLIEMARWVNAEKALGVDTTKVDDPLCKEIVGLFSSFARSTRYYNLDAITGSANSEEPLAQWDRVVGKEVVKRHHRNTKRHEEELVFADSLAMRGGLVVWHVLEDGTHVRDIRSFVEARVLIETKQKYSVYYALCIVEFCVGVLEALDQRHVMSLCLSEYFRLFNTMDRQAVLRRKKWNP